MTGLSENDGKPRQTFNISNTYPQTTPSTYQDFTGLQDYDEGYFIDSRPYPAATSIFGDDTGYFQSFSHDNEPKCGNEATANNFRPTQPAVPGFPLATSRDSISPFNVETTSTAVLCASTSTCIAEIDHCNHARIIDSSFGGIETQSNPLRFSNQDVSTSTNAGQVVSRDRVHCTWPGCTKTFGRLQELVRHHNAVHELITPLWCPVPSCNRSSGFPRRKRPFSRKDKLDSHMKNIHHFTFGHSMMAGVQAGLDAAGSGDADAESGSGRSGFNTADGFYDVVAPSILDEHALSNGLAGFVDPIGGYEPLDLDSVNNAGWFNGIDGVSSFNALSAADGIFDEQNISGEDMLCSG
ncbi:hypothetical protein COCSADRAFT_26152 [Bipolaris sorokiniana ND90Pr]|uniref:C2H2-type domain-containing protein n=1 Tax=Cochliobolus sativus (strain ND90Pr / ATCC 201652) TaxID=665912 RepID=M2REM1_COCSN|nr:uncharacterized protein COCSADRAFT_26152 [Bipolaris sorokiniana ND90Pr]EMD65214.1 hypothetical protein COCSADRAFT_26152 [Bipolaris sorokiniana ND90Pr]